MSTSVIAKASIDYKPLFQSCDNTGKRYTEEELNARASSKFAGRVLIEIGINGRKLIEFKVPVFIGKTELQARMPQEDAGNGAKRDAFAFDTAETDAILKLALRALRTEKTEQVEL